MCPTYLISARNDEIIDFSHAGLIQDAGPHNFDVYFPEDGGHDTIKEKHHDEYYGRLKEFLRFAREQVEKLGDDEYVKKYRGRLVQKWNHFYVEKFKPSHEVTDFPGKNIFSSFFSFFF